MSGEWQARGEDKEHSMVVTTIGHVSELPKALETAISMHSYGTAIDGIGDALPTVLVTMVGCPASGKSTARAAIMRSRVHGLVCETICPDDIRKTLTGDAADQSDAPRDAWRAGRVRCDGVTRKRPQAACERGA